MAKKYDLKLKGYVGGWDFDPEYVDWYLNKNADREVTVLIDSLGGSVYAALSLVAAFKAHGNVHVHFVGFNASAATIVSMGAKRVTMDKHAMYLVHKCSTEIFKWADFNADQLQQLIDSLSKDKTNLEKIDENISSMYAGKCKKTKAELLDLMKVGGWLTADEALTWGFIDEITDENEETAELTPAIAASLTAAGIPLPPGTDTKKATIFRRLLDTLASMFEQPTNHTIPTKAIMTLHLPHVAATIGAEEITATDGTVTLTEDNLNDIEAAINDQADEISRLREQLNERDTQIANLQNKPAEATITVIGETTTDEADDTTIATRAREMYNAIK